MDGKMLIAYYNAQVRALLEYDLTIWGSSNKLEAVFKIQKRILRTIDNAFWPRTLQVYLSKIRNTNNLYFIYT